MISKAEQMFPNPSNEAAISQAWESFLSGSDYPLGVLRSLVDLSWQRCVLANVDPNINCGPQPVSEQDMYLLCERQKELLEASSPVMACAHDYLAQTGTLMALADLQGTILTTEGDNPALYAAETIRLVPGVDWSETLCGTNAIGTALETGQPVQIHSSEHFCAGIKRWTCTATAIRHPSDGEIIGAIDVSGLSSTFNRQSLALVVTTASRIESRLKVLEMEYRYQLLELSMRRWSAAGRDAVVLFDRRGCPIKASEDAQIAISNVGGSIDIASGRKLPELIAGHLSHGITQAKLPPWIRQQWLEPLSVNGELMGSLLVIPSTHQTSRFISLPASKNSTASKNIAATKHEVSHFEHILTEDLRMRDLIRRAEQLAKSRVPVLLQGATGTGKEEFAKGIHGNMTGAYVALNCGGLSRDLLASELFGYAEGAFTGARKGGMIGKIEAANGGTLFLDEIGEMPLDMQPQLLRVLEQGVIYRLGENTPRKVNFRLVAATHRDLRREVMEGRFRMDLYYRVAVTCIRIPSLRERPADIVLLARHYLNLFRKNQGQAVEEISPEVLNALINYPWPGNVRELRNVIEGAVLTSESICVDDLQFVPSEFDPISTSHMHAKGLKHDPNIHSMAAGEEAMIVNAILATGGNLTLAAKRLNIAKSTLYAKMQRYGLSREGVGLAGVGKRKSPKSE